MQRGFGGWPRYFRVSGICVVTSRARAYFAIVSRLRRAGLSFASVVPGSSYEGCSLVITTEAEAGQFGARAMALEDLDEEPGVFKGQLLSKLDGGIDVLLAGVDPGKRIGLAVFYGEVSLEFGTFSSAARLSQRVGAFVRGIPARRSVVRVGNGSPAAAAKLLELLKQEAGEAVIETVDESGTSVRRMKGIQVDQGAAARIAFRKGETVSQGAPRTRQRASRGRQE